MPTGPFKSMQEQLAAWGFKPIDENGRTDTTPPKLSEDPATELADTTKQVGRKTVRTNSTTD